VPESNIRDSNGVPTIFPAIVLGEAQVLPDEGLFRHRFEVYFDIHAWMAEQGTVFVKQIAGAIRQALSGVILKTDDHYVADLQVAQTRFLRDPDRIHSHAVVTLKARLVARAVT
jgi:hypothetical protein